MPSLLAALHPLAAPAAPTGLATIATPALWAWTLAGVVALFAVDFAITRRPHDVSMREALTWTGIYIALPLAFGGWVFAQHGAEIATQYLAGYVVEKSLSVDNLFIFMLLLTSFAVPAALQQRVLLIGVAGAIVLRGIFIALGAQFIASFSFAFLVFGVVLLATAIKVFRDTASHAEPPAVQDMAIVRLIRRVFPVADDYAATRMTTRVDGRRALTPLALVTLAILGTDIVFAIDSVPAVYGITGDPYLVFVTNAFALLGLRALYFVLGGALQHLSHLGYGLAVILAFIGVKLGLHWAHGVWAGVPVVPTWLSLTIIVGVLATVTATSLVAARREGVPEATEPALSES